jgi:hypothetical protein
MKWFFCLAVFIFQSTAFCCIDLTGRYKFSHDLRADFDVVEFKQVGCEAVSATIYLQSNGEKIHSDFVTDGTYRNRADTTTVESFWKAFFSSEYFQIDIFELDKSTNMTSFTSTERWDFDKISGKLHFIQKVYNSAGNQTDELSDTLDRI